MLIQGDAVAIPLPDKSVHCAVSSPYWGIMLICPIKGVDFSRASTGAHDGTIGIAIG